jgi:flagellar motor component MotA
VTAPDIRQLLPALGIYGCLIGIVHAWAIGDWLAVLWAGIACGWATASGIREWTR